MPSSRWARRSRSAMCSTSARAVSKWSTSSSPGRARPRPAPAPGRPRTPRREWRRSSGSRWRSRGTRRAGAGPKRRVVCSATTGAGAPSEVRELRRELEDPAHLRAAERVDRLVRVADHDQVAAVTGQRLEQRDLARVGVLVLVDEHPAVAAAAEPPGSEVARPARPLGRPGPGSPTRSARPGCRGSRSRNRPAACHSGRPVAVADRGELLARRGRARGPGRATAAPRGRSPRVRTASASDAGHATASGVGARQVAQHDVLLRRAQQPAAGRRRRPWARAPAPASRRRSGTSPRSGVPSVRPSRAVTRSRSCSAALRLNVSARISSGPTRTVLDEVDDRLDHRRRLAGPGPARTSSGPPSCATTACCEVSRCGGRASRRGARRSVYVVIGTIPARASDRSRRGSTTGEPGSTAEDRPRLPWRA